MIDHIPAVLYGEPSQKVYLFVHGQCGCREEGLAFAEIACPAGYQVLAIDLPGHGVRKGEENRFNPWTVVPELQVILKYMRSCWASISLRANSIGAHFSMLAFADEELHKALFVSPIVNMERLINHMMQWADVTEQELETRREIVTDFGQTLSWHYLTWERQHPMQSWRCSTSILYAGRDNMTSRETVEQFVAAHSAMLTVMENGEHWFHTPEQLAVLQAWEKSQM
ncbi:alpha/beta hydrolase [Oscillibacter sp. GMB15532]|uniref:alpha/beta hydrolase n=1 Tax=Oscillibacter sp. GMB15532 TaxID=3230022 RepID=UPI0034DF8E45